MNLIDLSNINDVQKNLDQTSANTFTFASDFDWDSPSEDVIIKFGTNSQSSSNVPALKFGIDGSLQAKNLDGDYQYLGAITGSNHPQNTDLGTNATTFTLNNTNDNNVSTTTLLFGKLPEDTSDPAGIRNLNGVMQYKNSGAEWTEMGSGGGTSNPSGTSSTTFTIGNATSYSETTGLYFGNGTGNNIVGVRNNGGIMQYKNSGSSSWSNLGSGGSSYTLPPATADTLGGVKIAANSGLSISLDGFLTNTYSLPVATGAVLGGVKISGNDGITIDVDGFLTVPSSAKMPWTEVTATSGTLVVDNGYIANNSSQVTLTLPTTAAVGELIRVVGKGSGGWKIAQNAGQQIHYGSTSTTSGTGGYISSGARRHCVDLICITANTEFQVTDGIGELNIV